MITFYKMHGCGNDFIFIDNRTAGVSVTRMAEWAKTLCDRKLGVGADGIVFLENTPKDREGDYLWHFYNSDGSRGEMCGNASRCSAYLATLLGLAGKEQCFSTDAGLIRAFVAEENGRPLVCSQLTRPQNYADGVDLTVDGEKMRVYFVVEGVAHAVILTPDAATADVDRLGRALRWHEHFQPGGTNVNFVQVLDRTHLVVRTFERGVEAETLACGTGASASAYICHFLGLTDSAVSVTTSGGETLGVELRDGDVFLRGPATLVFTGQLAPDFTPPLA